MSGPVARDSGRFSSTATSLYEQSASGTCNCPARHGRSANRRSLCQATTSRVRDARLRRTCYSLRRVRPTRKPPLPGLVAVCPESRRSPVAPLLPVRSREPSEFEKAGPLRMQPQAKLRQPFLQIMQKAFRVPAVPQAGNIVVPIAHDDRIAGCHTSTSFVMKPQVQHVLVVDEHTLRGEYLVDHARSQNLEEAHSGAGVLARCLPQFIAQVIGGVQGECVHVEDGGLRLTGR